LRVGAIRAGKGLDRYITGDAGWIDELPIRHSIALKRFTHEIQDLGAETWRNLSKLQRHRKAIPSHILICVLAEKRESEHISVGTSQAPNPNLGAGPCSSIPSTVPMTSVGIPTWTPMCATASGPKFLSLSEHDQGIVKKLHNNL
jgi:hypothetical protein